MDKLNPVITADDVVRAGACREGVEDFVCKHQSLPAAVPASVLLKLVSGNNDQENWIKRAAGLDGYGDGGYGYGGGGGYGYGGGGDYGDGYGYGYGGYGYGGGGYGDDGGDDGYGDGGYGDDGYGDGG